MRQIILAAASFGAAGRERDGAGLARAAQEKTPKLKTTEFPDGTGTIGLPPGWKIDGSYRGRVGCKGPNGSAVVMGFPWIVRRPDVDLPDVPGALPVARARVGDTATALREVLKNNKATLTSLKSRPAPSGLEGVPAVYYLYEYQRDGKTTVGLGYFSTIYGGEPLPYWELYSSAMLAPKERFMKELPTLLAVYNSWRPNGKKPREGSDGAMWDAVIERNQKMRADSLKSQQEAFDRMNAKFRDVINN
jgi:hypothetical protein